jgi:hypothetical protein
LAQLKAKNFLLSRTLELLNSAAKSSLPVTAFTYNQEVSIKYRVLDGIPFSI